jgi:hypothetical protein
LALKVTSKAPLSSHYQLKIWHTKQAFTKGIREIAEVMDRRWLKNHQLEHLSLLGHLYILDRSPMMRMGGLVFKTRVTKNQS